MTLKGRGATGSAPAMAGRRRPATGRPALGMRVGPGTRPRPWRRRSTNATGRGGAWATASAIRTHMNVFVDGERAGLEMRLAPGAEVYVLTAIIGVRRCW